MLRQKKKQLNAHTKTSAKANRPPLRPASLAARKWNTFGKANTAPDRQSKRSPLVRPRRGGPGWNCRLQNAASSAQNFRRNAISQSAGPVVAKSPPGNAPTRRNEGLNAGAVVLHRGRHCRETRSGWRGNALHVRVPPPRRKPHAHGSAGAEMLR